MSVKGPPHRVLTLGYEKRSLRDVLAILGERGVRQLVDVRQRAASRKPGFAKSQLAASLARQGIAYVHMPSLGCSRLLREFKRGGGSTDQYVAGYRAELAEHEASLRRLVTLCRTTPSAVLCMERRLRDCHRQVLAEELGRAGFVVEDVP